MNRRNDWSTISGGRKPDAPKHHIEVYEDSMGILHAAIRENETGKWWYGRYEDDATYLEMPHGRYYLSEVSAMERGEVGKTGVATPAQHAADEFALVLAGGSPFQNEAWTNIEDPRKVNQHALLIIAQGDDNGAFAFYDSNMGETGKAFKKFFRKSPNRKLTDDDVRGKSLPMTESLQVETHAEEMPYAMKRALNQWIHDGMWAPLTAQSPEIPTAETETR